MLWNKDQTKNSDQYTDLRLAIPRNYIKRYVDIDKPSGNPRKSHKKSKKFRKIALDFMDLHNYPLAIEWLNKSICNAKCDTNSAQISYGHRSKCLYQLGQYAACLKDIELAKSSNYPDVMLAELNVLERECRTMLGQLRLSRAVQRNDTVYNRNYSDRLEFSVVEATLRPKRAVAVGETVSVDEPFVAVLVDEPYARCSTCFRPEYNLLPCDRCAKAMFCSAECQSTGLHKWFCTVIWPTRPTGDQMLVLCTVLAALKLYPTHEQLVQAVETFNLDTTVKPARSAVTALKYRRFFEACRRERFTCTDFMASIVNSLPIFQAIVKHRVYGQRFQSNESQRFLIHLIAHHWQFIAMNLHTTLRASGDTNNLWNMETTAYAKAVCFAKLAMKHSCMPSIHPIVVGKNVVYKAIRPIDANAPLSISYVCEQIRGIFDATRIMIFLLTDVLLHFFSRLVLPRTVSSGRWNNEADCSK